jgi:hypothetical protein
LYFDYLVDSLRNSVHTQGLREGVPSIVLELFYAALFIFISLYFSSIESFGIRPVLFNSSDNSFWRRHVSSSCYTYKTPYQKRRVIQAQVP